MFAVWLSLVAASTHDAAGNTTTVLAAETHNFALGDANVTCTCTLELAPPSSRLHKMKELLGRRRLSDRNKGKAKVNYAETEADKVCNSECKLASPRLKKTIEKKSKVCSALRTHTWPLLTLCVPMVCTGQEDPCEGDQRC